MNLAAGERDAEPPAPIGPGLAHSSALIILLSLLTLGLGFGVQMALAARLGTSRAMDVYLVAITFPTLGAAVAVTVFPSALVPVLRGALAARDPARADSIFRFAFMLSTAFGLAAAICVSLGAASVVRTTAPGLGAADGATAAGLLRVTAFGLAFDIPRGVLTARQYSLERYLAPQAAPSLNHLILLAAALTLLPRLGLGAIAVAWTAGSVAMLALLLPSALRPLTRAGVPAAGWASLSGLPAVMAVAALTQATPVVDRWVASTLPEGAIASLGYGSKILEVLMRTIPMGVGLAFFPLLSEQASRKRWTEFRQAASNAGRWLWLGAVPLALLVVMLREPWVVLMFERGDFDRGSSVAVAQGLLWYGLALLPAGGVYFLTYSHYAIQETGPLVRAGLFSLVGTFVLDLLFARWWGFSGIAAASLVMTTGVAGYLATRLWRQRLLSPPRIWGRSRNGRLVAALLMGGILIVSARWAQDILDDRASLAILTAGATMSSLAVWGAALLAFRDREAREGFRWVMSRVAPGRSSR